MLSAKISISTEGNPNLDRQVTFALATALTAVAKEAQTAVRKTLHDHFQIRTNWDVQGPLAIKIKPATKQDLEAWVGTGFASLEKFLRQDTGIIVDLPQGRYFAIPTSNVRRTPRDLIRAMQRPKALRGKRDFIIKTRARGILVLFQRIGHGKRSRSKARSTHGDPNMIALYVLYPERKIKEVDVLFGPTVAVFEKRFADILAVQLQKAFATAR